MILLDRRSIGVVMRRLAKANPAPKTELESVNTYTLLVAVVLSAQMTDRGVNKATRELFKVADSPERMLELGEGRLREYVKSVNLYPTKARRIIELSHILVERFGGEVPRTRAELESLPGVGRKTASVVLNVAFGEVAMPVDTHLLRLAPRLGLSAGRDPLAVEQDLLERIPARYLMDAHHLLLLHGRYVCVARSPKCGECCLADLCPRNGLA
ncbi:MAG TPA: endonuclease III [Treponemataceae bacterium]|jgi:endonuclease-3|nr:endonuclease III [Treponemataceae bacterium]